MVVERERERVNSSPSFLRRHKLFFGAIIIIGALLYITFNVWIFRQATNGRPLLRATPTPLPTPTLTPRPIPTGKQTFSVSSDKKTGPQFRNGTIDPYDPKANSSQTITVAITSSKPVTTGTLTMKTDTKTRNVPMSIVSGTGTNGVWVGT